jgi:hypothetical protein
MDILYVTIISLTIFGLFIIMPIVTIGCCCCKKKSNDENDLHTNLI